MAKRSNAARRATLSALLSAGTVLTLANVAHAQPAPAAPADAPPASEAEPKAPAQPAIGSDVKRQVPDYDGRGDEPVTAGDVLIWVPRTLMLPPWLLTEYVLRWPLSKLVPLVEENNVLQLVGDFFTFGPEGRFGIVPSFLIDFGLRPSAGIYFFGDDYIAKGHDIRSHLAFGGIDFYRATLTHRVRLSRTQDIEARFAYVHRPDWFYYGIGGDQPKSNESRYTAQHIEGHLGYLANELWRSSYLQAQVGARDVRFKPEGCCGDRTMREAVERDQVYPVPTLFNDGYTVLRAAGLVSLDTRPVRTPELGEGSDFVSPAGTGLKLQVRGELHTGLRETPRLASTEPERLHYLRYGGTIGGFLDLYNQRVVGVSLIGDFVDPLNDGAIPFQELVMLGGDGPMRGFMPGRLRDRSSVVGRLEYRWPIWVLLDGELHYSVGNVFGEQLAGFGLSEMRQSFGIGFRDVGARDHGFELLVAIGTEPFNQGGGVDTVRFVFGSSAGF